VIDVIRSTPILSDDHQFSVKVSLPLRPRAYVPSLVVNPSLALAWVR
jgi:hypothetical protein